MAHCSMPAVIRTWISGVPTAKALFAKRGDRYPAQRANAQHLEWDNSTAAWRIDIAWPSTTAAKDGITDQDDASSAITRIDGSSSGHVMVEDKDDLAYIADPKGDLR